ncbi:MAG: hypothetical protein HY259_01540 [Chloroflexi bacterium]|nr:hypothetical protein [Chloroflexota bacterium]
MTTLRISPLWRYAVRLLSGNLGSAILALLLSLFIWLAAVTEQNPPREDTYPGDIPVELTNLPPALVLFQPFERFARVRIRASQSSWERLQPSGVRALVDLSQTTAGLREFEVQVKFADPEITVVSIEPPRVSLRLEEQREKRLPVQVSISDSPPIGFLLGEPQSTPATVLISGPRSQVDQVAEAVAALQLRGAKSTFERDVPLIARDAQGNSVPGVRLSPSDSRVKVPVEQRLGFKDVSVKVITRNNVASGYWLSNILVEPNTVTLVGNTAALDEIGGFASTEPIDVRDANTSFLRRVGLALPDGVSPVSTQSVVVTIDIAAITGGQTIQRKAIVRGIDPGLKATLSPEIVDVILSGPLPVLQSLRLEDVQVILELVSKGPGKYKVTPTVIKPDTLKVESIVPDTIEVVVSK